jgi:hypothetical protein
MEATTPRIQPTETEQRMTSLEKKRPMESIEDDVIIPTMVGRGSISLTASIQLRMVLIPGFPESTSVSAAEP